MPLVPAFESEGRALRIGINPFSPLRVSFGLFCCARARVCMCVRVRVCVCVRVRVCVCVCVMMMMMLMKHDNEISHIVK